MNRQLTTSQVINMVKSCGLPVAQIERELKMPNTTLAKAIKVGSKKPLPFKYEQAFIDYIQRQAQSKVQSSFIEEKKVAKSNPTISDLSEEEKDNKLFWYNAIKEKQSLLKN